jgi:hypothetical protein
MKAQLIFIISQISLVKIQKVFIVLAILCISNMGFSQNCSCSVNEVESNNVMSCNVTIGIIDTVYTVPELQSAISQANSSGGNMTILIEDGDYQVASTSSFPYITGSNIVIRSLQGNRDNVIIRGGGNVPTGSTEDGFLIAGDNVTIADLTIREVGNHGIQVSGHNLYVHNVRIQDTYEQMIKGSTSGTTIDSAVVQCSLFEYTNGIGPNWYIGGLDIHKGNEWIVRDNVFKDITSPNNSAAEHAVHFWDNSINNLVERNIIYNCDRGIGFGLGNTGLQNQGGTIRNNIIYNDGLGQYDDVGIGLEKSPDSKVYNNTVYIDYFNAIEYRFTGTTNVDIINNLTNKIIASRNGGTGNLQTNFQNAQASWFVDYMSGNLRLATSIEEVFDKGTDLPIDVIDDIDQNVRPLNNETDIGAHEHLITGLGADQNSVDIFSDPVNNIYTLTGNLDLYSIHILDISGNIVQTVSPTGYVTNIDLTSLPSSFYFIRITNNLNGLISVQKIIVP